MCESNFTLTLKCFCLWKNELACASDHQTSCQRQMLLLLLVVSPVQLAASTASSSAGRTISFKPHDFETTVYGGVEKKKRQYYYTYGGKMRKINEALLYATSSSCLHKSSQCHKKNNFLIIRSKILSKNNLTIPKVLIFLYADWLLAYLMTSFSF